MALNTDSRKLFHGGDVLSASKESGIPIENWIDLSTGISPYAYPTNTIPAEAFSRLPYIDQAFKNSTKLYYGSKQFVAVSGTQAAIQFLPKILKKLPILLPSVGYQEHKQAWLSSGNPLDYYPALDEKIAFKDIEYKLAQESKQHLLVINPNNPSTLYFKPQQLCIWAQKLGEGAFLIVDEAFIDSSPSQSLIPHLQSNAKNNIIVFRSFGKFFGLAGIRLGFVFAAQDILKQFEEQTPLWSINGPALYLANKAFSDVDWQTEHQAKLIESEQLTTKLFESLKYEFCFHERLFSSYIFPKKLALTIYKHFYEKGLLLRLIDISEEKSIIRVGRIKVEDKNTVNKISSIMEENTRSLSLSKGLPN
tara:strand:- start:6409 stop:7500 length:1092 start_codon:yes stop_codon:yes gene_type:complete